MPELFVKGDRESEHESHTVTVCTFTSAYHRWFFYKTHPYPLVFFLQTGFLPSEYVCPNQGSIKRRKPSLDQSAQYWVQCNVDAD